MEHLNELLARANLGSWESWSMQYRVLAVLVGLVVAYWAIRVMVPTVLRMLWPFLFLAIVLGAVWALYPSEVCSITLLSKLPVVCVR